MAARLVKDINPNGSSSPDAMISVEGILYFAADLGSQIVDNADSSEPSAEEESTTNNQSEEDTNNAEEESNGEENDTDESNNADAESDNQPDNTDIDGETGVDTASTAVNLGTGEGLFKSDGTEGGTVLLKSFDSVSDLAEVNGEIFFIAGTQAGYQLWKTDGTQGGTRQVKDLYPGADPNFPQDIFELDGVLFYSANDSQDGKYPRDNGYEVWRREGEGIGSRFFRNLIPDVYITSVEVEVDEESGERTATVTTETYENDSFPRDFTSLNGNLFFTAYSSSYYYAPSERESDTLIGGLELWFSDGTESGTRPININQETYTVYDPVAGEYIVDANDSPVSDPDFGFGQTSASSFPRELTAFQDDLYFVANNGKDGFELHKVSDEGLNPQQVSNLRAGNTSSSPEELTIVNDNLYFTADSGSGRQLFVLNKQSNTPKSISASGTDPRNLTAIGNDLYYSAKSDLGRELWKASGKKASMVMDINPGTGSSTPAQFELVKRIVNKKQKKFLYFTADDGLRGIELWSLNLNSSKSKPERETDIQSGPSSSDPRELINSDQVLFFSAEDGKRGRELWTLGPSIVGPNGGAGAGTSNIKINENNRFVYQFSSTNQGKDQWSINGGIDSNYFEIKKKNGTLSFKSEPNFEQPTDDNRDNTYQVVVRLTDPQSGLTSDQYVNVEVINEKENGSNDGVVSDDPNSIGPNEEPPDDDNQAESGNGGGNNDDSNQDSSTSTSLVKNIAKGPKGSNPSHLNRFQSKVYFAANDGSHGNELWSSKGNGKSTTLFKDINKGKESANPSNLKTINKTLYFAATNGESGVELWQSDGSTRGTFQTADIRPGRSSSSPSHFVELDNGLLFNANDGENGSELWKVKTPKSQPLMLKDINSSTGSDPTEMVNLNQKIYFAATGDIYGRELWVSDGSKKGTKLLLDINPGGFNSNPENLTVFDSQLFFTAKTYFGGTNLWTSNGSAGSTQAMTQRPTQYLYSNVDELVATNDRLFFSATTTQLDLEPEEGSNSDSTNGEDTSKNSSSRLSSSSTRRARLQRSTASNINNYNTNIDNYKDSNDCDYVQLARFWAVSQLDNENDASLAQDWNNNYATACGFSQLIIPSSTISRETAKNYNAYLGDIDSYQLKDDCDFVDSARFWAIRQLEDENDASLARDWNNNYAIKCNYTPIVIAVETPSSPSVITPITGSPPTESSDNNLDPTLENSLDQTLEEGKDLGKELWMSRGSEASMSLVLDINPGAAGSNPTELTAIQDKIYFSADDGVHGEELWESDGTTSGTRRLTDINRGAKNSSPRDIALVNGSIIFSAIKDTVGRELWRLNDKSNQRSTSRLIHSRKGSHSMRATRKIKDEFIFNLNNEFGRNRADKIIHFESKDNDTIVLDKGTFRGMKQIDLVTVSSARQVKAQKQQNSNLIYFEPKGYLYFNSNKQEPGFGNHGGLFAIFTGEPDLSETDFKLI